MPKPKSLKQTTAPLIPHPDELPPYHKVIRLLSDRIVDAQRPIRILDACKWDDGIEERFFEKECRDLPEVTKEYYDKRPLDFSIDAKNREFYEIERDIRRELGTLNPCGAMMLRMCKEYRVVLSLIGLRGTPDFSAISQGLYGSTFDRFHQGDPTLGDLGRTMAKILGRLKDDVIMAPEEKVHDGPAAVKILAERMDQYFGPGLVSVKLDDGVVADAAAGADYIKIRAEARFSDRDLDVLEVHEGWVHIGTTLNGLLQPVATFLGKGTPSCTVTQEGLAIIQEVFHFVSHPDRIVKLTDRVETIRMAEEGADFLQCFKALTDQGRDPHSAYQTVYRAFRGGLPVAGGGPFTKDVSYSRGFILIYNFVRLAVRQGMASRIPLLFLGKLRLSDLGILHQLVEDKIVAPPRYLPPPYGDLRGLAAWMCYSNFLNTIDLNKAADDYAMIFAGKSADY